MSARSSSGSWSGAGRSPPDIIDLDKFMRGAVRPARRDTVHTLRCGGKLVVDAGGVDRPPGAAAVPSAPAPLAPPAASLSAPSDSSESRPRPHGKHFSHDSGLSDTSYARRKPRPHRRTAGSSMAGGTAPEDSSASLRAFRAVCERALLDQQAQIARVAQLCERLSERPPAPAPAAAPPRSERSITDSSDISSSTRSTRDQRRKDKLRTDECKTYKIIMNKLDELNRLFAARAQSPPPASRPTRSPPPASRRALPSSGSVSVSDKLVSTEPDRPEQSRDLQVLHNVVTIRGGSTYGASGAGAARRGGSCAGGARPAARARARSCALDVAPSDALPEQRASESVAQCQSRLGTDTSSGDPRCGFDLDDPVHLYSQAKRLQAMPATTRRARSVERGGWRYERLGPLERDARERVCKHPRERGNSLCSLCRGYWRSFRQYLVAQGFCRPDADAAAAGAVR